MIPPPPGLVKQEQEPKHHIVMNLYPVGEEEEEDGKNMFASLRWNVNHHRHKFDFLRARTLGLAVVLCLAHLAVLILSIIVQSIVDLGLNSTTFFFVPDFVWFFSIALSILGVPTCVLVFFATIRNHTRGLKESIILSILIILGSIGFAVVLGLDFRASHIPISIGLISGLEEKIGSLALTSPEKWKIAQNYHQCCGFDVSLLYSESIELINTGSKCSAEVNQALRDFQLQFPEYSESVFEKFRETEISKTNVLCVNSLFRPASPVFYIGILGIFLFCLAYVALIFHSRAMIRVFNLMRIALQKKQQRIQYAKARNDSFKSFLGGAESEEASFSSMDSITPPITPSHELKLVQTPFGNALPVLKKTQRRNAMMLDSSSSPLSDLNVADAPSDNPPVMASKKPNFFAHDDDADSGLPIFYHTSYLDQAPPSVIAATEAAAIANQSYANQNYTSQNYANQNYDEEQRETTPQTPIPEKLSSSSSESSSSSLFVPSSLERIRAARPLHEKLFQQQQQQQQGVEEEEEEVETNNENISNRTDFIKQLI